MSTLEEREQLIQQRQAEKYVNVIRMTVLVFLTVALAFRGVGLGALVLPLRVLPPSLLLLAWAYAFSVQVSVSRGFLPRYLPWVTTLTDLFLIAVGFAVGWELSSRTYSVLSNNLNWAYSLLFLLILFSTLRERPSLTFFNGVMGTVLYGIFLWISFPGEPFVGFWDDQLFRLAFLLLAGFFSTFHARSIRKAFQRAAASDRLRRETDSRLHVLALHFPGVLFQAEYAPGNLRIRYVSEGSRELLGLEPRDLIEEPERFFAKVPGELRKNLRERLSGGSGTNPAWDDEFPFLRTENSPLWLKLSVTARSVSGELWIINGLLSNVTEQRKVAEALRDANQAKTDFLATMSHELRTPLNAILGNADHLARLASDPDDQKAFRDLQGSGEALLGLIEDILVFSRLEAGRLVPEVRPVSWRSQLTSVVDTFRPQAQEKGLALTTRFPDDGPARIATDGLRLRQIVANLVGNAVKFTPAGSVTVDVIFSPGSFTVSVIDTGIGVPEDSLEKIFDKFTQGEHGKSRTYGGLGLGLSISRSLAGLLGGILTVESRMGEGSVFRLQIPVDTVDASSGAETPKDVRQEPSATKILLVEDNVTNQDVATRMLQRLGGQVDVAPGGREAIELASRRYYDLIIMDWQMPGMDGREATAKIRELPGGQDFVIVALSGHALPGDREFLLASGFDDYLSKPVRMDDFREVLAKWVTSPRSLN